jgi:hypothetical protein
MTLDLKFFYLGNQCPHNCYLLARIKTLAWQERIPMCLFDIWNDPATCEKYKIFSPTMLIVNERHRLHGPFTAERVLRMLSGDDVEPRAYSVRQSDDIVRGELSPITPESVLGTGATCAGADDAGLCMGKSEWVREVLRMTGLKHLGYTHAHNSACVGGAEFLPSELVPYPIPDKRRGNAFLTCSYLSDDKKDYKTHPLEALARDLKAWGFDTVSVAASMDVVFPNGPVSWFERKGFADKGTLITEDLHMAEIHYLQLEL